MKKLIAGVAMVVFSSVLQAATVNWGNNSGWAYSTNPNGSMNSSLFGSGISAGTAWLIYSTDNNLAGISVNDLGAISLGGGDSTLSSVSIAGPSITGAASGVTASQNGGYLAMVIYDSANKMYGVSLIQTLSGIIDAPPNSVDYYTFQNDNGVNGNSTPYMAANLPAVPEPMSLALFGLGAGVIGLRRRFKNKKA